MKYFTMCDWSTAFKEQYPEVYSRIETRLTKNEQSYQEILNLMNNPNSSTSSFLYA
jgi:DNA-binding HxlR family transcriptional regulator